MTLRIGILGSTRGTNLVPIVEAIQQKQIDASIEVVISNKADAGILQRAHAYQLPAEHIPATDLTREQYDQQVTRCLQKHAVELVVLVGYMRILSANFIEAWRDKIINVHPSLLPAFAGMMDMDVHRAVLAAKHTQSGCTVHFVTEEVDAGPIMIQKQCSVMNGDTPEELKQKVQALEGLALVEAIQKFSA